jgi:hypothetical protein
LLIGGRVRRNSRLLKQNFAPVTTLSKKLTSDAATIFTQFCAWCKKSESYLGDLEALLESLES